jgi:hypothetical protein
VFEQGSKLFDLKDGTNTVAVNGDDPVTLKSTDNSVKFTVGTGADGKPTIDAEVVNSRDDQLFSISADTGAAPIMYDDVINYTSPDGSVKTAITDESEDGPTVELTANIAEYGGMKFSTVLSDAQPASYIFAFDTAMPHTANVAFNATDHSLTISKPGTYLVNAVAKVSPSSFVNNSSMDCNGTLDLIDGVDGVIASTDWNTFLAANAAINAASWSDHCTINQIITVTGSTSLRLRATQVSTVGNYTVGYASLTAIKLSDATT